MGKIDIDNNFIDVSKYSFSILDSPQIQELKEYYRQEMISSEEFMKYYNCFPYTIVLEDKKEEEKEMGTLSKYHSCPNCSGTRIYRMDSALIWECLDCHYQFEHIPMSKDYKLGVDLAKEDEPITSRFDILDIRE